VNLETVEIELKKRWSANYEWGRKQADIWDSQTNFIYQIHLFDDVVAQIYDKFHHHAKFTDLRNYALNRWYNFHSAMAVEHIFNTHPLVRKVQNNVDKEKDFYINGLPFDHKTSVFPSAFKHDIEYALANPIELMKWLYINQSAQQRFHIKNRIFLVLHKNDGQHWRLKAELQWIQLLVHDYLNKYKESNLTSLKHSQGILKTDIIFGVR
jgi:hypothetical protein